MASRSVLVKVQNLTNFTLTRTYEHLSGGVWTDNQLPAESIPSNQSGTCQSESDGVATGTEGEVRYSIPNAGEVSIKWDDPFVGSNNYSITTPNGFKGSYTGGDGNNAAVTFNISQE